MEKSIRNTHWGAGSPALKLTESAVMLAFAFVLCLFPLASLPYGGTITACSMLPVVIIAYRYGWKWGLLTGFVFSLLQIVEGGIGTLSAFTKTPGSFLLVFFLDYVIAFTVLGLAGVFRGQIKSQRPNWPRAPFSSVCCAMPAIFSPVSRSGGHLHPHGRRRALLADL